MSMSLQNLMAQGPVILDGAWGTQLQARGLASGDCPDAWNLSRPAEVEAVARAYVAAGSQVILTNTFGANRLRLAGFGLTNQVAEINRRGVEISRRAAGEAVGVFASLGPSGKMLLTGDIRGPELAEAYAEQAQCFKESGADAIVVETMSDLTEAKLALAAARATGLPVVVSMVFDSGKEKDRTLMGVTPEQAAQELEDGGAAVVGANCGQGIAGYVRVCQRLRSATNRPLWIKANAGLPEIVAGRPVYRTTPEEFASFVPSLIKAGANFVGGCCGTNPDFIRAVKRVLR